MMSRKALLALAIPFSISSAFAMKQQIPQAYLDLKLINQNESRYVLKNAKGTLLQKSSLNALLNTRPENWFNLSPSDGAEGVRSEETYKAYGLPKDEIIVAVVDSGVDVNHEDLQGKIWINSGEIANDGIDNDKNGYVDDVFGWNFIGGSDGMAKIVDDAELKNGIRLIKGKEEAQISADSLEITRELARMKKLKAEVERLGEQLSQTQSDYLARLEKTIEASRATARETIATYTTHQTNYKAAEKVLKNAGVSTMTIEAVRAIQSDDAEVIKARDTMVNLLSRNITEARIARILGRYNDELNYYYNENFNPRTIVGDNYTDADERVYGNNDVIGPDAGHGTHCAGIIAAVRDNALGMKGVASNVKIMAVRVVPNGDERDKDVANGIRYAVDNGARIISMSFGKAYSPYKRVVDEAVKYAESKGVLLVHAAGNDSKDNDLIPSYPMRTHRKEARDMNNWLEIGASSYLKGATLPATFSNFGKKTVDVFAPGVDILSTTPDNTYDTYSGTSMATPAVSGVAALLLGHDSSMDADAVKALILDTSRRYPKLMVNLPGTEKKVLFSTLSTSGTIADAFEATKSIK